MGIPYHSVISKSGYGNIIVKHRCATTKYNSNGTKVSRAQGTQSRI